MRQGEASLLRRQAAGGREGREDATQVAAPQHPRWRRHSPKVGAEVITHSGQLYYSEQQIARCWKPREVSEKPPDYIAFSHPGQDDVHPADSKDREGRQ